MKGSPNRTRRTLLARVESAILRETANRYERVVALGTAGQVLLAKDGSVDELEFTEREMELLSGKVDLLVHNHPSGLSFSRSDVRTGVGLGARELVVFNTATRFRLRRAATAWPPAVLLVQEIARIWNEVVRDLVSQVRAGALTPAQAEQRHHHEVWSRLASRFDGEMEYSVERRS